MIEQLIITLAISISCAFVANVVTVQNGPLFVFSSFRMNIGKLVAKIMVNAGTRVNLEENTNIQRVFLLWKIKAAKSLGELVVCPFCLGPWLVLVGVVLFIKENPLIYWLIGSGMLYVWLGLINGH